MNRVILSKLALAGFGALFLAAAGCSANASTAEAPPTDCQAGFYEPTPGAGCVRMNRSQRDAVQGGRNNSSTNRAGSSNVGGGP